MNYETMKRINQTTGVKTPNNETIHATNQIKYEKLFHAIPVFNHYEPQNNDTKFDLLVGYNVHLAIARYRLKKIGNMNSLDLLNNINHTVSFEDLSQEVLLKFVEFSDDWEISQDGKVKFVNDYSMIEIFKAIDNYLYRFQTKHYKHMYIEIDGDIVDATKVSALSDYVSMDELLENIDLQNFMNTLSDNDKTWLRYRLDGLSNAKIALAMNVTYEKIRATEKRVRKAWNEREEK